MEQHTTPPMFEITRAGKYSLSLRTPVMPAAGMLGFGDRFGGLASLEKLGALVTSPVSYEPRLPAQGPRSAPLPAGLLLHTGLPNPGLGRVLRQYAQAWAHLPLPVIVHLIATTPEQVRKAASRLDGEEAVAAVELGLDDDTTPQEAAAFVRAYTDRAQKPLLVRLPLKDPLHLAEAVTEAGAGAVVVAAPPRGTARDPVSGRLVSGRIYGPLVKPVVLRLVGQLRRELDPAMPIIGAGGIHSMDDARDYIEAGARAVQLDAAIWGQPHLLERIARDLGGWLVTRAAGAYRDEWHTDMGDTEFQKLFAPQDTPPAEHG